MAIAAFALLLTGIWVLAWGSLTVANVVGGLAVAALLLTVAPDTWPRRATIRIRPLRILRFLVFVLSEVLLANIHLVRQVLARTPRVSTGVLAIPLPQVSDGLLTLIANTIALTPGTIPIHVNYEPTVMYVHFLELVDVEAGRRSVQRLASFAYAAFASDEAIEAFEATRVSPPEEAPS